MAGLDMNGSNSAEKATENTPVEAPGDTLATENNAPGVENEVEEETVQLEGVAEDAKSEDAKPTEVKVENGESKIKKPGPMMKTQAKVDYKNHKANVKYDLSKLSTSSDPEAIRKQVEFYFSDSNLPIDKFMWNTTGGPENKPVPAKTIASFGRMRRFQSYEKVVEALKESKPLLVEGEPGEETIRRKEPYDSTKRDNFNSRSVYVKGFGDETPSTQFDLEAFFTKFGPISSVRLRRTPEKLFKGSVFVEFADEESQKKFLALDPKPTWEDHELLIMSKTAYVEDKCEQIREGKINPSKKASFFEGQSKTAKPLFKSPHHKGNKNDKRGGQSNGRGRGSGRGGRGGRGGHRGGRGGAKFGRDVAAADVDVAAVDVEQSKGTKREREEDAVEEPPMKKVDTKSEVDAETA